MPISKNGSWTVNAFTMYGTNEVTSTCGKGSTEGSAKPCKNHVVVSIYNIKNQQMNIGSSTVINNKAKKTVLGVNPKRVYTSHCIYDGNNNVIDRIYGLSTSR